MSDGTDLATLGIRTEDALNKLSAIWVKTAEQLVAIAGTANGVTAIAEQTRPPRG
jgi:hypothetical protein